MSRAAGFSPLKCHNSVTFQKPFPLIRIISSLFQLYTKRFRKVKKSLNFVRLVYVFGPYEVLELVPLLLNKLRLLKLSLCLKIFFSQYALHLVSAHKSRFVASMISLFYHTALSFLNKNRIHHLTMWQRTYDTLDFRLPLPWQPGRVKAVFASLGAVLQKGFGAGKSFWFGCPYDSILLVKQFI